MALVQHEMEEPEGRTGEPGVHRQPRIDRDPAAGRAREPRDRQMREIGAAFWLETRADTRLIDLAVECSERIVRRYADPERIGPPAFLEVTDSSECDDRRGGDDMAERDRDILRHRPFDRADEAQRDVKLVVVLPARGRDALHYVEQAPTDRRRGAEGDEKTDHGQRQVNRHYGLRCNHSA